MLAQLAREPFDSPHHLFEIKWDGTRCLAFIEHGRIRLENRRFVDMAPVFPELRSLQNLPENSVLDGELIVLIEGKPSFPRLQERVQTRSSTRAAFLAQLHPATFMAFDLLYLNDRPLLDRPLLERRDRLHDMVQRYASPTLVFSEGVLEHGTRFFSEIRHAGFEGMMAKQIDSPYLVGCRSSYWKKVKVGQIQEFAIIGFLQREHEPAISALLLGEDKQGTWMYRGRVGSGFTEEDRHRLFEQLMSKPPLPSPPADGPKRAQWRKTDLRCRVHFMEKTAGGKLRAPIFKGLVK
ncbi:MAG: ATP-dependent DNA ligase [Nitrospirae bacterium]|nr:MAG: ATP-dependent DNA ligase [Nitrospirota bacterium]